MTLNNIKPVYELQKKVNQNINNRFFTTKKIIGFVIWSIILFALVGIVIKFVLDINFNNLYKNLVNSPHKSILNGAFAVATISYVLTYFGRIFSFWIKTRKYVKAIKWYEWLQFSFISIFIQTVTPFSFGSEPYAIWWLKRKGISIRSSTIIISINSIFWSIGQVFVTWPSFIAYSINNGNLIASNTINLAYWWVLAGLLVDLAMFFLIFAINYSRRIHFAISFIFNFIKKILKMKYLNRDEINFKYISNATYKKEFYREFFQWNSLIIFIICAILPILNYFLFVLFFGAISPNPNSLKQWAELFNIVNISTTANNFIPTPSTEGTLQLAMRYMLEVIKSSPSEATIGNSLFMWRASSNYAFFFSGLITFFVIIFQFFISKFYKKIKFNLTDRSS